MAALLGTLMVLCIPFALWGAILRANQADQAWVVLMLCLVPVGVMMIMAYSVDVGRRLRNRRRSRAPLDDDR